MKIHNISELTRLEMRSLTTPFLLFHGSPALSLEHSSSSRDLHRRDSPIRCRRALSCSLQFLTPGDPVVSVVILNSLLLLFTLAMAVNQTIDIELYNNVQHAKEILREMGMIWGDLGDLEEVRFWDHSFVDHFNEFSFLNLYLVSCLCNSTVL